MEFPQRELFTNWCERNSRKETHHAERRANGAFSRAETDSVSAVHARVAGQAGGGREPGRERLVLKSVLRVGIPYFEIYLITKKILTLRLGPVCGLFL